MSAANYFNGPQGDNTYNQQYGAPQGPPPPQNGQYVHPPPASYQQNGYDQQQQQQFGGGQYNNGNNNNYGMKPSQPYAAGQGPDNNGYAENQAAPYKANDTAPFSQATEKTGARFQPRKRLNDPIFLVLFIAAVAGFAVVSGLSISTFIQQNGLGGGFGNAAQGRTGSRVTLD